MIREIKFRAWINDYQRMIQISHMQEADQGVMYYFTDSERMGFYDLDDPENALMQFTGFYDCEGIPIYEGDLVSVYPTYDGWEAVREITFDEGGWHVYADEYIMPLYRLIDGPQESKVKVLGNKYQNPELLKAA